MASVSCNEEPDGKATAGSVKIHIEFWNNRLAATDPPLETPQSRIPEEPDQTDFLERWREFHQGYRIIIHPDGTESRIAVVGEPWKEVSPGFLPRTLDQLRAGRDNNASRPENIFRRRRLTSEQGSRQEVQQSIEEALDDLLDGLSDDEENVDPTSHRRSSNAAPPVSNRESPPTTEAPISRAERSLQRTRERLNRVFGTREDVQSNDYESPLFTIFNRAQTRYEQAEERRATGATDPRLDNIENLNPQERRELEEQILWGVLRDSRASFAGRQSSTTLPAALTTDAPPTAPNAENIDSHPNEASIPSIQSSLAQIASDIDRLQAATVALDTARNSLLLQGPFHTSILGPTLDQPGRPEPLTEEQMTKKLDCQICYSQLADIAVLPCGHMVMCQWCADIAVPVRHGHIPVQPTKCPMCRKLVKQRVKIHVGNDDKIVKGNPAARSKARGRQTDSMEIDEGDPVGTSERPV